MKSFNHTYLMLMVLTTQTLMCLDEMGITKEMAQKFGSLNTYKGESISARSQLPQHQKDMLKSGLNNAVEELLREKTKLENDIRTYLPKVQN
jgi:hypothetical protein